ncbi:hypothetical protein DW196_09075 [Vagococcus sp. AM17-17]|nr:hypothetical protein DW196_09075 [Vagococcus sp. AM17-17]
MCLCLERIISRTKRSQFRRGFIRHHFPFSIRKNIYATNLIEGFNKQLKKRQKEKNNSLMKTILL